MNSHRVLVTGAAGYIGSHACVALREAGYEIVGVDSFAKSSPAAVARMAELAGPIDFHELDLRDPQAVDLLFATTEIHSVMHFAGLKSVGESVQDPLGYFEVNVGGTLNLLRSMSQSRVTRLVFSSSCTVYGNPDTDAMPLSEDAPLGPVSPYGRSKLFVERILEDLVVSDSDWRVISLRYFNPVGAHASGMLGEDPTGIPKNLMPYIMQTAVGSRSELMVFGGDYDTPDGTCIRDYIHVVDLVKGHVAALDVLDVSGGFEALNLGTGIGSSVLDVLRAAEKAIGAAVPHRIVGRRPGDAIVVYADPTLAEKRLGWTAERDLDAMCADHWRWQQRNPHGYASH